MDQTQMAAPSGEAFARPLLNGHGAVLMSFALYLRHGDLHQTEDLLQAVRAWRYREEDSRPRLLHVMRNAAADQWRRQQAREHREHRWAAARSLADRLPVRQAVASLPAALHDVAIRLYWLDAGYAATARELAVHPGTMKSRQHRPLKALRPALADEAVA